MRIKDLKHNQEVLIIDSDGVWPVKIDRVGENQHIYGWPLIGGGYVVHTHPEDIKSIEPMEGRTILEPSQCVMRPEEQCVMCPKEQKLVSTTGCLKCGFFCGKTMNNHIICEPINKSENKDKG